MTLRLSAQSRTVVSSISSTVRRPAHRRRYRATARTARSRARGAARRRGPAQSAFAAGLAGLGWRIRPILDVAAERLGARCSAKRADADDERRSQRLGDPRERVVADLEERRALGGGQLVGRAVPPDSSMNTSGHQLRDEDALEEPLGGAEAIAAPSPRSACRSPPSACTRTRDRPPRMLARRLPDLARRSRGSRAPSRRRRTARRSAPSRTGPGSCRPSAPRAGASRPSARGMPRAARGRRRAGCRRRHRREPERVDARRELAADGRRARPFPEPFLAAESTRAWRSASSEPCQTNAGGSYRPRLRRRAHSS